ncbi:MAG: DUF4835 family protein [Muribaculaceae bacterium]|nr:DUF4835 family protein [Muribaculaceae bacterium]
MIRLFTKLTFIILIALAHELTAAQELNCQVEFNTDQIAGSNKSVFETLQEAVTEYMNTTKFSNAQLSATERLDCRMFFTIKENNDGQMTGDLQVQLTRPVYNTNYTTNLINFKDTKIDFTYQEGEPLTFSETTMESQLTAILNFYAYLFLAIDFDSFSPRGGQPFFDRLSMIVQMGQSSGESGWKAFEDSKNRSAILAAYTDASTQGLRDMIYAYHRTGLDEMATAPDKGRQNITKSLEALTSVYNANPMSVGLSMFKDSKIDELVNIYSEAPANERTDVYDLLYPIFPTETKQLDAIKAGKQKR